MDESPIECDLLTIDKIRELRHFLGIFIFFSLFLFGCFSDVIVMKTKSLSLFFFKLLLVEERFFHSPRIRPTRLSPTSILLDIRAKSSQSPTQNLSPFRRRPKPSGVKRSRSDVLFISPLRQASPNAVFSEFDCMKEGWIFYFYSLTKENLSSHSQ
jgi:hypothetical protein